MPFPTQTQRVYPPKPTRIYFYSPPGTRQDNPWVHAEEIQLLEREDIRVHHLCTRQRTHPDLVIPAPRADSLEEATKDFPESWPIVIPSGTYASMMRHYYPKLFVADPVQRAQFLQFSQRVFEFTEFLVHVVYAQNHFARPAPIPAGHCPESHATLPAATFNTSPRTGHSPAATRQPNPMISTPEPFWFILNKAGVQRTPAPDRFDTSAHACRSPSQEKAS